MNQTLAHIASPAEVFEFFDYHSRLRLSPIRDSLWLTEALRPQCRNGDRGWNGGVLSLLQHPEEMAHWLILLAQSQVKTYFEIGVHKGGSLYVTDSYLRATVTEFKRSIGCDPVDAREGWKAYARRFPATEFWLAPSDAVKLRLKNVDAALIDGCHRARQVRRDWDIVKGKARIVGFHDIAGRRGGVRSVWEPIKECYSGTREFVATSRRLKWSMGIGVVDTESKRNL